MIQGQFGQERIIANARRHNKTQLLLYRLQNSLCNCLGRSKQFQRCCNIQYGFINTVNAEIFISYEAAENLTGVNPFSPLSVIRLDNF